MEVQMIKIKLCNPGILQSILKIFKTIGRTMFKDLKKVILVALKTGEFEVKTL